LKVHCFSCPSSYCTTRYGIAPKTPFPEKPPWLIATRLKTRRTDESAT